MPKPGVNIDHVATLRQARRGHEPNPVEAAALCEKAGADGITVHLREMAATDAMVAFAAELRPDMATLVPERREELTTEGVAEMKAAIA